MGIKWLINILFLLVGLFAGAQNIVIKGQVVDAETTTPVNGVSVIAQDSVQHIKAYNYSDEQGRFTLTLKSTGTYNFIFSALGYKKDTLTKSITTKQNRLYLEAQLIPHIEKLDKVLVESDYPIEIKKDTISFLTKYFTDGTEETVEELLKKIPGLNIDSNGTIKIGNQEIEKVMVEGDDFFSKGYKLLTKNMPAFPIKGVDILKHYSNNKLLKNIEESHKVALDLKLKDNAKRVWFGNIEGGGGDPHAYMSKINVMNFGKKNKYYFLGSMNNIGYSTTEDIADLIYEHHFNEPGYIGEREKITPFISLSNSTPNLPAERYNFNNDKLLSLNAIFNPNDHLKIKPIVFFDWNDINLTNQQTEAFKAKDANFTTVKKHKSHQPSRVLFGKLDLNYDFTKTQHLKSTTSFHKNTENGYSSLLFNDISTVEHLNTKNNFIDQNLIYTDKINPQKAFLISGRFKQESAPSTYQTNQFYFQDLFPEMSESDSISEKNKIETQYFGINAHLLDRHKNDNLLELQIGNEYRRDKLKTSFTAFEEGIMTGQPEAYQNHFTYAVNDLYLKGKYVFKIYQFSIAGALNAHQLFNTLQDYELRQNQSPFYINPGLNFTWEINRKNNLFLSYNFNKTNAKIKAVLPNYTLTGFRSFSKGTGEFNQLKSAHYTLGYSLGNWSDQFFASLMLDYVKNYDFYSTKTTLKQDYVIAEKLLVKNQNIGSANAQINYYVSSVKSNFKALFNYYNTHYKNLVNNSELRKIQSSNYSFGLEARSSFNGFFNYHIGTKWKSYQIDTGHKSSFTDRDSFLNLYFRFNEIINFRIKTSYYHFGSLQQRKNYTFMDLVFNYNVIPNKLSLKLSGLNLLNLKTFRRYSINDVSSSIQSFKLFPRMIMLSGKLRF